MSNQLHFQLLHALRSIKKDTANAEQPGVFLGMARYGICAHMEEHMKGNARFYRPWLHAAFQAFGLHKQFPVEHQLLRAQGVKAERNHEMRYQQLLQVYAKTQNKWIGEPGKVRMALLDRLIRRAEKECGVTAEHALLVDSEGKVVKAVLGDLHE